MNLLVRTEKWITEEVLFLNLRLVNKHGHIRNDDRGYCHQHVLKHAFSNASKNVVWSHIRPEIGHSITLACSVIRIRKIQ
jgi:hypothetical protein